VDYHKATSYLESLQSTNIKLGLERIGAACVAFGHPEKRFPSVIVAGTNGKGSTCAFLESILRHHGLKVGLYTSPHLMDVRERIQIDRKMIGKKDFVRIVEMIVCHCERSEAIPREQLNSGDCFANARNDILLTYFEFLTLMAFIHFAEQRVDIAVLEVGLGGRFDATNVATPLASVITRIGLDHEKYLGNTLEKIAFEKAGIIKEGVPVVTVDQGTEAMRVIRDIAEERHAMLHVVSPQEVRYKLGLLGEHQNENAALALRAAEVAGMSLRTPQGGVKQSPDHNCMRGIASLTSFARNDIFSTALASTRWPGRLELVSKKPLVILDGAHNPNGAKALARFLKNPPRPPFYKGGRVIAIFGAMEDKDINGIIAPLLPVVDEWVITMPDMERAAPAKKIVHIIRASGASRESYRRIKSRISEFPNVKTAIKETLAAMSKNDTLIITGSLYMVAEAKEYFGVWSR